MVKICKIIKFKKRLQIILFLEDINKMNRNLLITGLVIFVVGLLLVM